MCNFISTFAVAKVLVHKLNRRNRQKYKSNWYVKRKQSNFNW